MVKKRKGLENIIRVVKLIRLSFMAFMAYLIISYFRTSNEIEPTDKMAQSIPINNNLDNINKIDKEISIFCIILTEKDKLDTIAGFVHESWAHKCTNHVFLTQIPDNENPNSEGSEFVYEYKIKNLDGHFDGDFVQKFTHINLLQPPNLIEENYDYLSKKLLSSFRYIFMEHEENLYDWYLKCDHDTFVNMKNLNNFLLDKNEKEPISYGRMVGELTNGFLSGGAGYVMSKDAFQRFGSQLTHDFEFCQQRLGESVDVFNCLRSLNCSIGNSMENNRNRFHSENLFKIYPDKYVIFLLK
jgi:hypothetical protein